MSPRARIDEVLQHLGLADSELLEHLRDEGLFPEDEVTSDEAEELRVAIVLMQDMGVNAAGVDVALHLRSRLLTLQSRAEEALRILLRERD
jgi:hypothetical protein